MKKEVKIIIIISVLITIIGGGLIFLKYHKSIPEIKPSIYGRFKTEETLSEFLKKSFLSFNTCSSGEEFDFSNKEQITFKDLSEDNVYHILYNYLDKMERIDVKTNIYTNSVTITKENMQHAVNILFGKEIGNDYQLKDSFKVNDGELKLVNDNYVGEINDPLCAGRMTKQYYVYKSYMSEEKYNLEVILYWLKNDIESSDDSNQIKPYNEIYTKADSNPIAKEYVNNKTKELFIENAIEENKDKFVKYRMVFSKENSGFIFDHIELVK